MSRKRTRPMDVRIMCEVWWEPDFMGLTADAQLACIKAIGKMGRDATLGPATFTNADLGMDEFVFASIARELVAIGAWAWLDDNTVEVSQYKKLIVLHQTWRPLIAPQTRRFVFDRDGHACCYCGATDRLELDHIYPYSLGGGDSPSNLQVLCKPCNFKKGAKV